MKPNSYLLPRYLRITVLLVCASMIIGCEARQSHEQYEENLHALDLVRLEQAQMLQQKRFQDPQELTSAARDLRKAAKNLDSSSPPRDAQDAHVRMLEAVDGLIDILQTLATCMERSAQLRSTSAHCSASVDQASYDETRNDFLEASTIYKQSGYEIGEGK